MKKRFGKWLSILLTMVMLVGLMPTTALAATTIDTINITGITAPVAGQTPETSGITENIEGFSIFTTQWRKQSDNSDMYGKSFEEGVEYFLMIDYTLDDGYEIGSELNIISDTEASRAECRASQRYINLYYTASSAAGTYTVSFYRNSGSGEMAPVTVEPGEYTLPECGFTNTGYEFSGWAVGRNSSTELKQPGDKITITGDITLYAKWQKKSFTITAVSEDESKGTVTGGGTFEYSDTAYLTATPKEGYEFDGWYNEDGDRESWLLTNGFFVSKDATYTAKFKKADKLVTAANAVIDAPVEDAHPDMTPEASDADKYSVTLNQWYWIKDKINNTNFKEMTAEDVFVAGEKYELRVVFAEKEGYKFADNVVFTVNNGETDTHGTFDVSSPQRKIQFEISAAATYAVTVTTDDNGTASASPAKAKAGETVTLTAEAAKGYEFDRWEVTEPAGFTFSGNSFKMPAGNVAVKAIFKEKVVTSEPAEIKLLEATVTKPVAGANPSFEATENDERYDAYDVYWMDGNKVMQSSDVFEAGKTYTVEVWFIPEDGYTFADDVTAEINGKDADKVNTANEDGSKAIAFTREFTVPAKNTNSGGGGGSTKYKVVLEDTDNGNVESSRTKASKGTTVYITTDPDAGYGVDDIEVTKKNGEEVEVTDKGDGRFAFKMPAANVYVTVDFEKIADGTGDGEEAYIRLTIDSVIAWVFDEYVTNDVPPVIRNERTMLPARFVAEALGGVVTWDEAEQKVTIVNGEDTIVIFIGEPFATVNGDPVELDSPAFIENSRTYLPIRFIAENMGATVTWDADARTVKIVPGK